MTLARLELIMMMMSSRGKDGMDISGYGWDQRGKAIGVSMGVFGAGAVSRFRFWKVFIELLWCLL